jgi:hypothetical protein
VALRVNRGLHAISLALNRDGRQQRRTTPRTRLTQSISAIVLLDLGGQLPSKIFRFIFFDEPVCDRHFVEQILRPCIGAALC